MIKKLFIFLPIIFSLTSCTKKSTQEVDNETLSAIDFSSDTRDLVNLIAGIHQGLIITPGTGANQIKSSGIACQAFKLQSGDTAWGTTTHVNPTFSLTTDALLSCRYQALTPTEKNNLGYMTVRLSDKLQNAGTTCVIKLNKLWVVTYGDYYSTQAYKGCDSIILKTISSDANGAKFELSLVNGKTVTDISGLSSTLSAKYTFISTVNGISVPQLSFFGTASGINSAGLSYTVSIAEANAIAKTGDCYHLKAGIAEIIPFGYKTREIDYGTGNCDDMAKMKVNGNSIAFKLK